MDDIPEDEDSTVSESLLAAFRGMKTSTLMRMRERYAIRLARARMTKDAPAADAHLLTLHLRAMNELIERREHPHA